MDGGSPTAANKMVKEALRLALGGALDESLEGLASAWDGRRVAYRGEQDGQGGSEAFPSSSQCECSTGVRRTGTGSVA